MKILVTGGAGFIGSAVCRHIIHFTDDEVINLDALTYAGDLSTLAPIADHPRYTFEHADIRDPAALARIFARHKPDAVMHLAAESHVDRSIDGPSVFIETNIVGTYNMLAAARAYYTSLEGEKKDRFRFHHISTDEVYGTLGETGQFTEDTPYNPNSPYSASKASSDHLVRAWHETYGLPVVISNCSNNYGPYQYPEKLIPVIILNALSGQDIPIYGEGKNVRDWLYVEDHARALCLVLKEGKTGEKYNVGGDAEVANIDMARMICSILDDLKPDGSGESYARLITYVTDRPGHDLRYAIDFSKITQDMGWTPQESLESGLRATVAWYLENLEWCKEIADGIHAQRQGLKQAS